MTAAEPWREVVRELMAALEGYTDSIHYYDMRAELRLYVTATRRQAARAALARAKALLELDATQSEESDDH